MSINSYREKQCLYCGVIHKHRGPYCSKICSNKDRRHSDETKAKMSNSQSLAQSTMDALDRTKAWSAKGKLALAQKRSAEVIETNHDDLYLPPMRDDTPDGAFRAGDDLWFNAD